MLVLRSLFPFRSLSSLPLLHYLCGCYCQVCTLQGHLHENDRFRLLKKYCQLALQKSPLKSTIKKCIKAFKSCHFCTPIASFPPLQANFFLQSATVIRVNVPYYEGNTGRWEMLVFFAKKMCGRFHTWFVACKSLALECWA